MNPPSAASGMRPHNHGACVSGALDAADALAKARGARFTPVRRRALEILLESHTALGAYDLLKRLEAEGFGAQPPVAYRALDFLVELGVAHRIEKLNAFVACMAPGDGHDPAFMICRACRAVEEVVDAAPNARLAADARDVGFAIENMVMEAEGLCPKCRESEAG